MSAKCSCGNEIQQATNGRVSTECKSCICKRRLKLAHEARARAHAKMNGKCIVCGQKIPSMSKYCGPCKTDQRNGRRRKTMQEESAIRQSYYVSRMTPEQQEQFYDDDQQAARFRTAQKCQAILDRLGMTPNAVRYTYREVVCADKQISGKMKLAQ